MKKPAFVGSYSMIMIACDPDEVNRVTHYTGGKFVLSGGPNKLIKLWDAATGKVM